MKISYTNYKKAFPGMGMGKDCFNKWFYFNRYFSGKMVKIGIKHHEITIDFAGDIFKKLKVKRAP